MNSVELRQAVGILFISEIPHENFVFFWGGGGIKEETASDVVVLE